jgi:hypothetical protein
VSPLWLTNVTPVAASHAAPLSEVIVPVPETAVMRTGNGAWRGTQSAQSASILVI